MSIVLRGVSKRYGEFTAVDGIDLEVPTGALLALVGPSGCGKTTLLRIIAGLDVPDAGQVSFDGVDATRWPIQRRRVGFVFQNYALFRHMSVFDNVAFGLKVKARRERPSAAAIRAKVQTLLELVQLSWAAGRFPAQLSGGQKQRVALARALAVDPRVLLLDEPFGALDPQVRHELRRWLRRLHAELHFTSILVTHDQQEAIEVADIIAVLNRGRLEQVGAPGAVYDAPASAFVQRFLGQVNELPLQWREGRPYVGELPLSLVAQDGATKDASGSMDTEPAQGRGDLALIRPHDIDVGAPGVGWEATVSDVRIIGPIVRLELRPVGGGAILLEAEMTRERFETERLQPGQSVAIRFRRWQLF